jgi:hypothetical protein
MVGAGIAVLVVGGLAGLITFGFGGTFALWSSGCSMCDSEEEEERAAEHRKYQRIAAVGGVVLGSSIITGIVLISVGSRRLRRLRGVALTPAGLRF